MNLYVGSLLLGAVGFTLMALSGMSRGPHGARFAKGHIRGAVKGPARGHSHHSGNARAAASHLALALMSPRFLFSVAMGAGLTGLLLRDVIHGAVLPLVATGGGLAFERFIVSPLWDSLMRFGSEPALTLESCAGSEAVAVTAFDRDGLGIVAVELDGQLVQLLATLAQNDRARVSPVRAGARLRIDDVDAARNRCTVSLFQ
jgi:hypothetical protein